MLGRRLSITDSCNNRIINNKNNIIMKEIHLHSKSKHLHPLGEKSRWGQPPVVLFNRDEKRGQGWGQLGEVVRFGNKWTELLGDGEPGYGGEQGKSDQSRAVWAALALLFAAVVFDCSLHVCTEKRTCFQPSEQIKMKKILDTPYTISKGVV